VLGAEAARDVVRLVVDPPVEDNLARSRPWATEEVQFEDFHAAVPRLAAGVRVLFRDYVDYHPGVMAFVDEFVASGEWAIEQADGTLCALCRAALACRPEPAEQRMAVA
jgi:hypothetical protein